MPSLKNCTLTIEPLVTVALVLIVMVAGAVKVAPFFGLVIVTVGGLLGPASA